MGLECRFKVEKEAKAIIQEIEAVLKRQNPALRTMEEIESKIFESKKQETKQKLQKLSEARDKDTKEIQGFKAEIEQLNERLATHLYTDAEFEQFNSQKSANEAEVAKLSREIEKFGNLENDLKALEEARKGM